MKCNDKKACVDNIRRIPEQEEKNMRQSKSVCKECNAMQCNIECSDNEMSVPVAYIGRMSVKDMKRAGTKKHTRSVRGCLSATR